MFDAVRVKVMGRYGGGGCDEISICGDGDITRKWISLVGNFRNGELMRWGVQEMGSSGDG